MAGKDQTIPASGHSRNGTTRRATISEIIYTVSMLPELVDELDQGFSPMDGIVAIDEIFSELPLLHRALAPKRLRKRARRTLKVYRGCYDWYKSLGFSYVQLGTRLHILELWFDENPRLSQIDVVLGTGQTEGYEPFGSSGVHHDVVEIEDGR
jgi:hypothetical protein